MRGVYTERITDIGHENTLKMIFETIKPELIGQKGIERFYEKEEGVDRTYNVYKITIDKQTYILKKSDDREIEVYQRFLQDKSLPVPKLEGSTCVNNTKWILIEYITGTDLRIFNQDMAYGSAESLAKIFNTYWQKDGFEENRVDERFQRYWTRINIRAECLKNELQLAAAYRIFMNRQLVCPRTLCNGDFLQCNAIDNEKGIILIDWGFAGIMPYSLDIARLIAHGSEKKFPFPFYMTDEYRKIFLEAVYDKLVHKPDYRQFIFDVILSCLNECIEFIEEYLNAEPFEEDEYFAYYYKNAKLLAEIILNGKEQMDMQQIYKL